MLKLARVREMRSNTAIALVTLFIALFANGSFYSQVLKDYPLSSTNALPLFSVAVFFAAATAFLLGVLCIGRLAKPLLMLVLVLSAAAAYFMDSYNVVISDEMLQNVIKTDPAEVRDLLNVRLFGYLLLLGVLPAFVLSRITLVQQSWRGALKSRAKFLLLCVVMVVGPLMMFGSFYASFIREHKSLRSYANPTYYLYSVAKYGTALARAGNVRTVESIGMDAVQNKPHPTRRLMVMVVGETARADRFGLNGYARETTPQLSKAGVVNYPDFWACGTSTAVSVPCMFALGGQGSFSLSNAGFREGAVDVLHRAGVKVIWMDNNSDSKGVALRVPYKSYKSPENNPMCDDECRDEGMLQPMQEFIDAQAEGDVLVILHQMGNHGPAYYKRYPKAFEEFTPVCQTNDLSQCSREEIGNAYDNAIRYTDHFLGRIIETLKTNEKKFATTLFYVSDHGESLGENGVYLHGLPNAIAPDAQVHVPAVIWLGEGHADLDGKALQSHSGQRYTHDWVFHTLLGYFHVKTAIYQPELDLFASARR